MAAKYVKQSYICLVDVKMRFQMVGISLEQRRLIQHYNGMIWFVFHPIQTAWYNNGGVYYYAYSRVFIS
jgi:hypothetical protein